MKKSTKLLIAVSAVAAGIALGYLLVNQSGDDYIGEEEVRAIVTDRYAGEIEGITQSDDERFYIVSLRTKEHQYEIKVNRDDSNVENIATEKITQNKEDKNGEKASGEQAEKEKKKSSEESVEKEEPKKSKEKQKNEEAEQTKKEKAAEKKEKEAANTLISEKEAKEIASNEVGGEFVHLTLNQNTHPKQYQIIQRVDDDDEGALVTVDAIGGEALKVLWFTIDFNNIADIEAFAHQLQDYNTQYQNNYYIEFGDDSDNNVTDDHDVDEGEYDDDDSDDGDDGDDGDDDDGDD